jgi:carbon starvation protein CstA
MYFVISVVALILGYVLYGTFVQKVFGADDKRPTPAKTMADGVDFVEMPSWRIWLIQLLNIAGVGPVFGPILGALWGPAALLWIVIGTIFAGAVHDYFAGMLSIRYQGANVPDIVGYNLGNIAKQFMRLFSVVLLVLVGVVFVGAPAGLLSSLFPADVKASGAIYSTKTFWVWIIFAYYFVATIMPIDKIIGRIYPLFGAVLIFMAVGVSVMLFLNPDISFYNSAEMVNQHPKQLPLYPLVFITIACGAISGFHSTQSPLMARCVARESLGKPIFYGSMISEGFIGLVWATVGMSFYHGSPDLAAALAGGGPGKIVTDSSIALLGTVGGILAILGVVVLPITSGDTAFRAARLTIAEVAKYSQRPVPNRLYIAVPVFIIGIFLNNISFDVIWRYFGWANQTLAMIVLWAGAAYLYRRDKFHWICSIPATFMTAVTISYICYEPKMGFNIPIDYSNIIGVAIAIVAFVAFMIGGRRCGVGEPENA